MVQVPLTSLGKQTCMKAGDVVYRREMVVPLPVVRILLVTRQTETTKNLILSQLASSKSLNLLCARQQRNETTTTKCGRLHDCLTFSA